MQSLLFLENTRSRIMRLLLSVICSAACMAFSNAFDKREQSSVLLKGYESGRFASIVKWISDCLALLLKDDKIRLTVSFSQKRIGVMVSKSDWAVCRYFLII